MDGSTLHFIDSYHLLSYDELDSTNEEAKRLAKAGGQHGAVIWSKLQTEGKGRAGRTWVSEEGNLFFSLLLQPCAATKNLPQLSFVTALALHRALREVIGSERSLTLKWPNDVLVNQKKIAGILLETLPVPDSDAHWIIIGIGVNIMHYPEGTRYAATSLKDEGVEIVSAKIVLSRFLNSFEPLYDEWLDRGFSAIREEWLTHAAFFKQQICLMSETKEVKGEFSSINHDGHIVIIVNGISETYAAGDMRLEI